MRNAQEGTYNGDTTFCTVNAYGACPHCDQCNVCHAPDPFEECAEWNLFFESWDEWVALGDKPIEDIDDDFLECGFDPYSGCYTDDC